MTNYMYKPERETGTGIQRKVERHLCMNFSNSVTDTVELILRFHPGRVGKYKLCGLMREKPCFQPV